MLKKSVRIQLFKDGEMISDRLVTQTTEFYTGPKETHDGPMRIEFTIDEKKDAEQAIEYLQQLMGKLPIKTISKPRGRSPIKDEYQGEDKFEVFKKTQEDPKVKNQDDLINVLREMSFIFMTSDYLKHFIPEDYTIKKAHLEKYQWLIRRIREAKTPINDKFDPQILLGVDIMSKERSNKMVLYAYGTFKESIRLPIPEKKPLTFGKTNLMKFPMYMNEEERLKWGTEHRALLNDPNKKPSKFYLRWFKDVRVGDELKITAEDILNRQTRE